MLNGYQHGHGECNLCFNNGKDSISIGDFRLYNNPTYSGGNNPEVLVLGFSKGANQNKAIDKFDFDKVAFADMRDRLSDVLDALNIMPKHRDIDSLISASEKDFGFASLVRCSFCKMENDSCKTSGKVVTSAFTDRRTLAVIEKCTKTFLGKLPARVKLVVLLGTDNNYIKESKKLFSKIYSDFTNINNVAFRAGGALWVYAAHPSRGNGHFSKWVKNGVEDPSGKKRILSLKALEGHHTS